MGTSTASVYTGKDYRYLMIDERAKDRHRQVHQGENLEAREFAIGSCRRWALTWSPVGGAVRITPDGQLQIVTLERN